MLTNRGLKERRYQGQKCVCGVPFNQTVQRQGLFNNETFVLNASFHRVIQEYQGSGTDESRSSDFNWKNSDQPSKDAGHSSPDAAEGQERVLGPW